MYRIETNICEKLCVKLVIYKDQIRHYSLTFDPYKWDHRAVLKCLALTKWQFGNTSQKNGDPHECHTLDNHQNHASYGNSSVDCDCNSSSAMVYFMHHCFTSKTFYVLLTVQPGMILVNNQLDAQFFTYVYLYSLHVSISHVPIVRRIIVSVRHLVYVTLYRWPSGMQEHMLLHTRRSSTQWHKPGVTLKQ